MPRFLHQGDPDLSDLNRAKRNVNRDYKKQYSAQDGNHDNLGQSADVDSIYNTLSTRLLALQTALTDLYNILEVGGNSQNFFSPQQRAHFQQFASRVLTEVGAIQLIMGRIKNFNMFTPIQAQGLGTLVDDIVGLNDSIETAVAQLPDSPIFNQIEAVINTYQKPLNFLFQFLQGATKNYQALEANPTVETMRGGVAFHYRNTSMTGGAIVPAYNGLGVFGSDGYRIGDYFSYTDPRRFY
jgi:hypothetical protein